GDGQGRGPKLAAATGDEHEPTKAAVNLLADDFQYERFTPTSGVELPYAFHLPSQYDPAKAYALVVILPGYGQGYIQDSSGVNNEGVQVASDIPAVAWLQEEWTGTDDE